MRYAVEDAEYCRWLAVEELPNYCERCDGEGYDGFEEETGNPYICYACCGTGK